MIRLMVAAHRPHCALQPRQPYTWPGVRGATAPVTAVRTSWSLRTLQEQMIIGWGLAQSSTNRLPICQCAAYRKREKRHNYSYSNPAAAAQHFNRSTGMTLNRTVLIWDGKGPDKIYELDA